MPSTDPRKEKWTQRCDFEKIVSPIHPVDYEPPASEYKRLSEEHFVLKTMLVIEIENLNGSK